MSEAIIQALIGLLINHMNSATNLSWKYDITSQKTFKIFALFEFQGIKDPNIELSITADNTDKFIANIANKNKNITDTVKLNTSRATEIMNRARQAFDQFLDENLYYHYINYIPREHSVGFNPVAPTVVFGPFISAQEKLTANDIELLSHNYDWIKSVKGSGSLLVLRYTTKRKDVDDADIEASNTIPLE